MKETNRFSLERVYQAPIAHVWKAISDQKQLKEWYFDFSGGFILKVGQEFDWYGGPPDGKQWHHHGKMLEIIEGKKLSHSWEYPGYSGTSTVTWELFEVDDHTTRVKFTHVFHVPFDANEEALRRENFEEGWNHILAIGLVDYLKNTDK